MEIDRKKGKWVFVEDEDGHWYCVPLGDAEDFKSTCCQSDDDFTAFIQRYDDYRVDGYPGMYAVENPQWIEG